MCALKTLILPGFSQQKIRIASVGCSTGKEPYSILIDNWNICNRLQVDGYDIHFPNIANAKRGNYFLGARTADYTYLEALDLEEITASLEHGWVRIGKAAKVHASFHVHNLLISALPKKYHVIVALNFLYHFKEDARETIVRHINESLYNNGWLLCEHDPSSLGKDKYPQWMQDLERFGLRKKVLQIPFVTDEGKEGVTDRVLAYRKK